MGGVKYTALRAGKYVGRMRARQFDEDRRMNVLKAELDKERHGREMDMLDKRMENESEMAKRRMKNESEMAKMRMEHASSMNQQELDHAKAMSDAKSAREKEAYLWGLAKNGYIADGMTDEQKKIAEQMQAERKKAQDRQSRKDDADIAATQARTKAYETETAGKQIAIENAKKAEQQAAEEQEFNDFYNSDPNVKDELKYIDAEENARTNALINALPKTEETTEETTGKDKDGNDYNSTKKTTRPRDNSKQIEEIKRKGNESKKARFSAFRDSVRSNYRTQKEKNNGDKGKAAEEVRNILKSKREERRKKQNG